MESRKIWEARIETCKQILEILLNTEFKSIGKVVHFLIQYEPDEKENALARAHFRLSIPGLEYLKWLTSMENHSLVSMPHTTWMKFPDLNDVELEAILKHKLTQFSMNS